MRIFLLVLSLSIAAYQGQKAISSQASVVAAAPNEQPANIIFQSADGGKSWQDISVTLPEKLVVNRVFTQDGEIFLGTEKGLYHSRNPQKGDWEREDFGEIHTNDFGLVVLNERVTGIFPGRSGPYVCISEAGFFRKIPGTSKWQPMHEALEDKAVFAVLENTDGTILVGCPSGIYKSADDGKTWKHVFTERWVMSLTAANGVLIGSGSPGLLRSTDGGEHWNCVLPDENAVYNTNVIGAHFAAVRVTGPWCNSTEVIPLRTSADNGKTWQRMDEGLSLVQGITDLQQVGNYLFCSHKDGISRSIDGGINWELMRPSPDTGGPIRIGLAVSGQTVFAVIMRGGC